MTECNSVAALLGERGRVHANDHGSGENPCPAQRIRPCTNVLARRVLEFGENVFLSRRWFYLIPAKGEPKKLVHRIEPASLDAYPGSKDIYLKWQDLEAGVGRLVAGHKTVAMEYVPRNANPSSSTLNSPTCSCIALITRRAASG